MRRILFPAAAIALAISLTFFQTAQALTNSAIAGTTDEDPGLSISSNGRFVLFESYDTSLASGLSGNGPWLFLKDTQLNTTTLVSINPDGTPMNNQGTINRGVLTKNGRFALFTAGRNPTVYLRDLQVGTTTQISPNNTTSYSGGLSEDGRFIYYIEGHELMLDDTLLGVTTREDVNVSGTGTAGINLDSVGVSCDGRYAVFSSDASDLVPNDTNGNQDIFLVDNMNGHEIKDITIAANGGSSTPSITCNGDYILFTSSASNLVPNDDNSATDLFQYNVESGAINMVDIDPSGNQYGNLGSQEGGLNTTDGLTESEDGRYVTFAIVQEAAPQQAGDAEFTSSQVFLRDMQSNTTTALSPAGYEDFADYPAITYDGREVFYGYSSDSAYPGHPQLYEASNYL